MNTIEFTKAYKAATGFTDIFPNTIPSESQSCTGVYTYGGTAERYLATGTQKFQFLSVSTDRQAAELTSNKLMKAFMQGVMINQDVDDNKIHDITLLQLAPMYIGKDDLQRYQFSFNIEVQISIHN